MGIKHLESQVCQKGRCWYAQGLILVLFIKDKFFRLKDALAAGESLRYKYSFE